jgi:hypothetical protein
VREAAQVAEGDTLQVRVARGAFDVVVKGPVEGIS